MAEFVRGANGSVIGIALEGHPDEAPDAPAPTTMIPIVPIPEHALIGDLPDVIEQANELAAANDRNAALEQRIAELEAAQAANASAGAVTTTAPGAPDWSALAGGAPPAAPAAPADPNAPPAQ